MRATGNPWPTWPVILRTSSAHEEGGERLFAVNTERFLDDGHGNVRGLRAHEVVMAEGRFERVDGTDFDLPCDLVLLAMGFTGPERGSWLERLGVAYDARGNVVRDAIVHERRAGRVRGRRHGPGPEPDRLGHRRGAGVRRRRRPVADGGDGAAGSDLVDDPAACLRRLRRLLGRECPDLRRARP